MARGGMTMLDIGLGVAPKRPGKSRDSEDDPTAMDDGYDDDDGYDGESDGDQACIDDLVDAGFSDRKARALVEAISALIERRAS